MLSLSTALSFFGASALLAAAPGPDVIFVLTQSLIYGRRAGLWTALGNVSGVIVHTTAVALGLGALIANSPAAYNSVKYIGASYLVYLAYRAFRDKKVTDLALGPKSEVSQRGFLLQGAMVSILNPHVTVLFIAFLPQFVDVQKGQVPLQVVSLGLLFMLAALIVFSTVAYGSGMVRQKIERSPSTLVKINRAAGFVFLALALRLFMG